MNGTTTDRAESRAFQFSGRIRSFRYAIAGIVRMIRCQRNAWIHAIATVGVIAEGCFFIYRLRNGVGLSSLSRPCGQQKR